MDFITNYEGGMFLKLIKPLRQDTLTVANRTALLAKSTEVYNPFIIATYHDIPFFLKSTIVLVRTKFKCLCPSRASTAPTSTSHTVYPYNIIPLDFAHL